MSGDWIDAAEQGLCEAIEATAKGNTEASELNALAGALAALKWGPEGGSSFQTSHIRQRTTQQSSQKQDQHITEHDELGRRANPTGFASTRLGRPE